MAAPQPIPDYQTLMLPLLKLAAERELSIPEAVKRFAVDFHMTAEQLAQLLPSGRYPTINNRAHWAKTYLVKAGLLEQVRRGVFRATQTGKELLKEKPERIDSRTLLRFPSFVAFQSRDAGTSAAALAIVGSTDKTVNGATPAAVAPDEIIDNAITSIETALRGDLLDRLFAVEPASVRAAFFERLVLKLLVSMGYGVGWANAVTHLGGRGDGGVDGVIHLDALGIDRVYIQAKCYDRDVAIQPGQVRDFSGSLDDKKIHRGVFITTAKFTEAAKRYVAGIQKQIVLIDGIELSRLMIRHNVGVRLDRVVEIKRLDEDFFEDQ